MASQIIALFGVLVAFFGIGTFPQINAITHAMQDTFNVPVIITATVVTVLVAMIILGGVRRYCDCIFSDCAFYGNRLCGDLQLSTLSS